MLADHAAKRLQPKLQIIPDAGELARVEPALLQQPHHLGEVALDRGHVEVVGDAAREVADLEEVHQPLQAHVASARADSHLHLGAFAAHEQLGQLVQLHPLFLDEPVEQALHPRILGAERFLEPFA